jgi:23S rRNA pseudouridine2605 synthase
MTDPSQTERRLNQFLAEAGVCSRRDADDLIRRGAVTVNGAVVADPAVRVDPQRDAVKASGRLVKPEPLVYILMNKPIGVISTLDDPEGRTTVRELLRGVRARVYPVGRLDWNTEGVLLLTNDGDLAQRLTHPRYGFPKTYLAKVRGYPEPGALRKLALGVRIPGWDGRYEKTLPARARVRQRVREGALLELTLREGRQHQVKKMCAAIGFPVLALARIRFGFLTPFGLAPGQWRHLTPAEVSRLKVTATAPAQDERSRHPRRGVKK